MIKFLFVLLILLAGCITPTVKKTTEATELMNTCRTMCVGKVQSYSIFAGECICRVEGR